MRVMKFGGSSLASGDRLNTVVKLVLEAFSEESVVVVTSALAGITDLLTGWVEPNRGPTPELLPELAKRHLELRGEPTRKGCTFEARLRVILDELEGLGAEATRSGGWTPASRDRALGIGERAAALLLSCLLEDHGVASQTVDGPDVIRTDSTFGSARVNEIGTRHLARWTLGRIPLHRVPVVAGFTGGDDKGQPTTLGRGSSDLTATLLAAATVGSGRGDLDRRRRVIRPRSEAVSRCRPAPPGELW